VDSGPESKDEEIFENYSVFRKFSYTYNINQIVVHTKSSVEKNISNPTKK
jgi:hypothetical protein